MPFADLQAYLLPALTGSAGTLIGFAATCYNENLNERREYRKAVKHNYSEVLNALRHYQFSAEENAAIADMPPWERVVQLGKCRFYGNGLGSFELSALRLFKPEWSEQILDFMLVVRNNDFYIDQAIHHSRDADSETFDKIMAELLNRFEMTLTQGRKLKASLQERHGGTLQLEHKKD